MVPASPRSSPVSPAPQQNGQPGLPPVGDPQFEQLAFASETGASVLFLILGIIGMTQEYRHRTATPTFLTDLAGGAWWSPSWSPTR